MFTLRYHENSIMGCRVYNMPHNMQFESGESITIPLIFPFIAHGSFLGWSTNPDGGTMYQPGETIRNMGRNINLYAIWSTTPLYVVYYGNDLHCSRAHNVPKTLWVGRGLRARISPCIPVRKGYVFRGWNSDAEGCGISYMPCQVIDVFDNIYLYAQWSRRC